MQKLFFYKYISFYITLFLAFTYCVICLLLVLLLVLSCTIDKWPVSRLSYQKFEHLVSENLIVESPFIKHKIN